MTVIGEDEVGQQQHSRGLIRQAKQSTTEMAHLCVLFYITGCIKILPLVFSSQNKSQFYLKITLNNVNVPI